MNPDESKEIVAAVMEGTPDKVDYIAAPIVQAARVNEDNYLTGRGGIF